MRLRGISKWLSLRILVLGSAIASGHVLGSNAVNSYAVSDVRCVVVGLRMAEMNEPQKRAAGTMLALYYLGRLDVRSTDSELEGLVEREAETMTQASFRANAARCGKQLTLKGQEIQKIGADLSNKGGSDQA